MPFVSIQITCRVRVRLYGHQRAKVNLFVFQVQPDLKQRDCCHACTCTSHAHDRGFGSGIFNFKLYLNKSILWCFTSVMHPEPHSKNMPGFWLMLIHAETQNKQCFFMICSVTRFLNNHLHILSFKIWF